MEQITLLDGYLCDGCDVAATAPGGELPTGWVLIASGLACNRKAKKGSRCQTIEVHYCPECNVDQDRRLRGALNALKCADKLSLDDVP